MGRMATYQWGPIPLYLRHSGPLPLYLRHWVLFTRAVVSTHRVLFNRRTRHPTTQIPPIIHLVHQPPTHTAIHLCHQLVLWIMLKRTHRAISFPDLNPRCLTQYTLDLSDAHRISTLHRSPFQTHYRSRHHGHRTPCSPFRNSQGRFLRLTVPLRLLSVMTLRRLRLGLSPVIYVRYPSTVNTIWNDIEKPTQERNPSSATGVAERRSREKMHWNDIKWV